MNRVLVPIALGLASGLLVSLARANPVLVVVISWIVFIASFWQMAGHPVGLLTSSGGLLILLITGGLYLSIGLAAARIRSRQ